MSDFNAEVKAQFELIDKKVGDALARHDGEVAELGKASKRASQELKDLTSQHAELHAEMKKMGDAMTALEQRGDSGHGSNMENAGIGSQFVASDAFSRFVAGDLNKASATFQNNTIVTGGDNSVTRHEQLNGVVAGAVRQLTVLPTITQGQSSSNIVYYSRELAWTNAAAEVHCREGSLESWFDSHHYSLLCSLPRSQLRNKNITIATEVKSSLPRRQLRN